MSTSHIDPAITDFVTTDYGMSSNNIVTTSLGN